MLGAACGSYWGFGFFCVFHTVLINVHSFFSFSIQVAFHRVFIGHMVFGFHKFFSARSMEKYRPI